MTFRNSSGLSLIPNSLPPRSYLDWLELDDDLEYTPEAIPRKFQLSLWVAAISSALLDHDQIRASNLLPTIGFFNPETEEDGFGIILREYGQGNRYGTGSDGSSSTPFEDLLVADHSFRVIRRKSRLQLHTDCHPEKGRGTCFSVDSNGNKGVLTCGHVIGTRKTVDLEDNAGNYLETGSVLSLPGNGIDAGTIETTQQYSSKLKTEFPVSPWDKIQLVTSTGAQSGVVTAVTETRGSLSQDLPARIFIDVYGAKGDSGSPVYMDDGTNDVLAGLYAGKLTTKGGAVEGYCQLAAQAEHVLNIELFKK